MSGLMNESIDLMIQTMESGIKKTLEETLVEKLVEDFKKDAKKLVREELEKVTFESITRFRDLATFRDQLEVRINYGGGDVVSNYV